MTAREEADKDIKKEIEKFSNYIDQGLDKYPSVDEKIDVLGKLVVERLGKVKGYEDGIKANAKKAKEDEEFARLVIQATEAGEAINKFDLPIESHREALDLNTYSGRLTFFGFLEGDYAERGLLPMPIALQGGFFLETPALNILFDPGTGTIRGLKDQGIDIRKDDKDYNEAENSKNDKIRKGIDAIIVSHRHPQAFNDLHQIFNELGGFIPERAKPKKNAQKVLFFSSEAVIKSRNGHPSVLVPSDLDLIYPVPDPEADPKKPKEESWIIRRKEKTGYVVTPIRLGATHPLNDMEIRISILPAYHSEATKKGEELDHEGLKGEKVSCFLIETSEWGILFTGDTEYPWTKWGKNIRDLLKDRVTVLIANTKTLEYLHQKRPKEEGKLLRYTRRQLGFQGTLDLTENLKPRALIMRAFGLETVLSLSEDKRIRYTPENLRLIWHEMRKRLNEKGLDEKVTPIVLIPGRHEVNIKKKSGGNPIGVDKKLLIPAFPPLRESFGIKKLIASADQENKKFVTADQKFAKKIESSINYLKNGDRPFMVIEGASGMGKTLLAECIAEEVNEEIINSSEGHYRLSPLIIYELRKESTLSQKQIEKMKELALKHFPTHAKLKNALREIDSDIEKKVETLSNHIKPVLPLRRFDLATFEMNSREANHQLFGFPPTTYSAGLEKVSGQEGLFGQAGTILILNQLEKIPLTESQKLLDLLEEWCYTPVLSAEEFKVASRIIFTTNIRLNDPEIDNHITHDLKNRLKKHVLTIPDLYSKKGENLSEEISLVIHQWCLNNKANIASEAWDLLRRADWRVGAFRALRNVLDRALSDVRHEYHIFQPKGKNGKENPIVFIPIGFVRDAMQDCGITEEMAGKVLGASSGPIPRSLIYIMLVWIGFGLEKGKTREKLAKVKATSSPQFNAKLKEIFFYVKEAEEAWDLFPKDDDAIKTLENEGIEAYCKKISRIETDDATDEINTVGDLFLKDTSKIVNKDFNKSCKKNLLNELRLRERFIKTLNDIKNENKR